MLSWTSIKCLVILCIWHINGLGYFRKSVRDEVDSELACNELCKLLKVVKGKLVIQKEKRFKDAFGEENLKGQWRTETLLQWTSFSSDKVLIDSKFIAAY